MRLRTLSGSLSTFHIPRIMSENNQGVAAALSGLPPARTVLSSFLLDDRVAVVTGAQRGIGLEMALALAEAGAIVYCLDLPANPGTDWLKVQDYVTKLPPTTS